MEKTHHELKCQPIYFEQVIKGFKTFELRNNDRKFKKGDLVIFTDTGREHTKTYKFINDF